ncbi:hypothetical protein [Sphingomonas sp. Leaf67]|uniref:hypothetical protein n=1 Tax=Sphingomonas sp. Leaf67 TaxID=1736230 RepID=UPI0009E7C310|nr:hypothetical protein [Sphingomonas sp. Leaf67]
MLDWQLEQERALRRSGAEGRGVMKDTEVVRFIVHYERLTRHILEEIRQRADIVVLLDKDRRLSSLLAR